MRENLLRGKRVDNGMNFYNGWSQEKMWRWVEERMDLPHKRDLYNNGYKVTWENGDTYEIEYGSWQPRVPGTLRIKGELVYTKE